MPHLIRSTDWGQLGAYNSTEKMQDKIHPLQDCRIHIDLTKETGQLSQSRYNEIFEVVPF